MAKSDMLQVHLKIDKIKDREIYEVLNLTDNKSDFIKDALFYYMHQIEQNFVINRNYPYNKINIRLDIVEENTPNINTVSENIKLEVDDIDESEDNFDDIDF